MRDNVRRMKKLSVLWYVEGQRLDSAPSVFDAMFMVYGTPVLGSHVIKERQSRFDFNPLRCHSWQQFFQP
jgi:hypothetical protein